MTRALRLAADFTIPSDAVTQTFAILAKRGVGKTYTALVLVEELLKAGHPTVVVDPVGVCWGLRAAANGTDPGLPIIVMGGDHGDVPLEASAGKVVAEFVVAERRSVVLDLSLLRKGEQVRFMTDFAETLYHRNRLPLHLVLDEADAFAAQKPMHDEARMLGALEDLIRRGRARGIGVTLVTQRAAVLNKNVLTQIEVLVVLRTISPQDRGAIEAWIRVHGTTEQGDILMASLPSLPVGTAWFWSPGWLDLFKRVEVRRRETFDSSATPKAGAKAAEPKRLADVDLEKLKGQIAATIERAKAEDPKELRRQLAAAKAEIAAIKSAPAAKERVERVEVPVLSDTQVKKLESLVTRVEGALTKVGEIRESLDENAIALRGAAAEISATVRGKLKPVSGLTERSAVAALQGQQSSASSVRPGVAAVVRRDLDPGAPLPKAERAILTVLAQHQDGCEAGRLALLAGYRWSGGFRNSLSALRTAGLMVGENSSVMRITDQGLAALGDYDPLPTGQALIDYWLRHPSLGKCERAILEVLITAHPKGLRADELAARTGYEWSGGFRNALSALRTAGLLVGKNSDEMRAVETLFAPE
jgi:hypothetical protein